MSDGVETGLREWLAHREHLAATSTSADRVIERVEAAVAGRRAIGLWRLAPAVAALGIAALLAAVVTGSLGLRGRITSPAAPGRPFVHGVVPRTPPPPGLAVTWVRDPLDRRGVIAYDWSGAPRGRLELPRQSIGFPVDYIAAPDGSRLVVTNFDSGAQSLITAQGTRVATLAVPPESVPRDRNWYPLQFADDDRTMCQERHAISSNRAAPRTLYILSSDGTELRHVPEAPPDAPAGLRWALLGCSVRSDTVVLAGMHYQPPDIVQSSPVSSVTQSAGMGRVSTGISIGIHNYPEWVVMVRALRLSTGVETWRHVYPDQTVGKVSAAPDGSAVVEGPMVSGWLHVRDLRAGEVQAIPVSGDARFTNSPAHHLLVVDARSARGPSDATLLDWPSGRVLWRQVVSGWSGTVGEEPGGDGVLVQIQAVSATFCNTRGTLMIDTSGEQISLVRLPTDCPSTPPPHF